MESLISIIKKITDILYNLEELLIKEQKNLLKNNTNFQDFNFIMQKKKYFFKKLHNMQEKRFLIEKKNNIFAPYTNYKILHNDWSLIVNKYILLRDLNHDNKKILEKKFFLNQNFLELVTIYSNHCTYDINGNLKN